MSLQPRLIRSKVLISFGERVDSGQVQKGMVETRVEEWKEVGLCIHQYNDDIENKNKWRITHVHTGRAVLRHIRTREEAITYMMMLRMWRSSEMLKVDWHMTDEQFQKLHYREEVVGMINTLQKQISGEVR